MAKRVTNWCPQMTRDSTFLEMLFFMSRSSPLPPKNSTRTEAPCMTYSLQPFMTFLLLMLITSLILFLHLLHLMNIPQSLTLTHLIDLWDPTKYLATCKIMCYAVPLQLIILTVWPTPPIFAYNLLLCPPFVFLLTANNFFQTLIIEPHNYEEVVSHPGWQEAMNKEF